MPSSRVSTQPRDQIPVSHTLQAFFTDWATGKPWFTTVHCCVFQKTLKYSLLDMGFGSTYSIDKHFAFKMKRCSGEKRSISSYTSKFRGNWICVWVISVHYMRPSREFCTRMMLQMEKAMAPHSSTPAWKIPWTEEPGRLQTWNR